MRYAVWDLLVLTALLAGVVCFEASPFGFGAFTRFGIEEQVRNIQVGGFVVVLCTTAIHLRSQSGRGNYANALKLLSLFIAYAVFVQIVVVTIVYRM